MAQSKVPPVIDPAVDVAALLEVIIGETGDVHRSGDALLLKAFHLSSFPFDEVFKTLLYRDYTVTVKREKADIFVEAQPPKKKEM